MPNFLQAQSQAMILLVVLCVTSAAAGIVILMAKAIRKRNPLVPFASMMPALLPMGVILSLLLAFLSGQLWANLSKATDSLDKEITALYQIAVASRSFPPQLGEQILEGVKAYVQHALEQDWRRMSSGHGPILNSSPGLALIIEAVVFTPQSDAERMLQQFIVANLSEVNSARTNRTRASQYVVAPIVWGTIIGLGALVMIGVALTTSASLAVSALSVALYSLSFALTLAMLIAFDRPFEGGVELTREPLRDLARHLEDMK